MLQSFTATLVIRVLSEKWPELGEAILDVPIVQLAPNFNFTFSDRWVTACSAMLSLSHCR